MISKDFRSNERTFNRRFIDIKSFKKYFSSFYENILGRRGNKRKMEYLGVGKRFKDSVLKINFHSIIFEWKRDTKGTMYFCLVGFCEEALANYERLCYLFARNVMIDHKR